MNIFLLQKKEVMWICAQRKISDCKSNVPLTYQSVIFAWLFLVYERAVPAQQILTGLKNATVVCYQF